MKRFQMFLPLFSYMPFVGALNSAIRNLSGRCMYALKRLRSSVLSRSCCCAAACLAALPSGSQPHLPQQSHLLWQVQKYHQSTRCFSLWAYPLLYRMNDVLMAAEPKSHLRSSPLVTALFTVSRSARTSFNCLSRGWASNETKNGAQVARVGLQEGAFVNERPDRDLPDDLLRHTLGRATISCVRMRKSRSRCQCGRTPCRLSRQ
jgi:hypothetical protein